MEITLSMSLRERFWRYANYVTDNKFKVDEENQTQLKRIIEAVENSPKGLLICGKTGSGKTFIFEVLSKIYRGPFDPERIILRHCDAIVAKYEKNGEDCFIEEKNLNVVYDELGREKNPAKHYGSDCDVMQRTILKRYELFKKQEARTYFTSNYSAQDLRERYGDHCFSRLSEMVEIINLGVAQNYKDRRSDAVPFIGGLPEVLPYWKQSAPTKNPPENPEFMNLAKSIAEKMKR
jgi:hypothetical protein